jgi:uncharacterized RDD family membrane protein YckC
MRSRAASLLIRLPDGVVFSLPLAGPVTRFLAWLIDAILIAGGSAVLSSTCLFLSWISFDFATGLAVFLTFVVQIGYGIFFEWIWRGQTPGKRMLRLRVTDVQGFQLRFNQVAVRNMLRFVDMLPACYLVGGVVSFLNSKAQRLGDIAANTVVVRQQKNIRPDLDPVLGVKYNSFRDYPRLEARVRQRVSPAEAEIALGALLRRNDLDPAARVDLFRAIADRFRVHAEFPPEAVENLPDEQYVRNVVDIVFRQRQPVKLVGSV